MLCSSWTSLRPGTSCLAARACPRGNECVSGEHWPAASEAHDCASLAADRRPPPPKFCFSPPRWVGRTHGCRSDCRGGYRRPVVRKPKSFEAVAGNRQRAPHAGRAYAAVSQLRARPVAGAGYPPAANSLLSPRPELCPLWFLHFLGVRSSASSLWRRLTIASCATAECRPAVALPCRRLSRRRQRADAAAALCRTQASAAASTACSRAAAGARPSCSAPLTALPSAARSGACIMQHSRQATTLCFSLVVSNKVTDN